MADNPVKYFAETSSFSGANAAYLEDLYESYLQDPANVPAEWRSKFDMLPKSTSGTERSQAAVRAAFLQRANQPVVAVVSGNDKQFAVNELIEAYRRYGHLIAKTNPLPQDLPEVPVLALNAHGLSDSDLNSSFQAPSFFGPEAKSLREIVAALQATYCDTAAPQYSHINNLEELAWLKERIERNPQRHCSDDDKKRLLHDLTRAEGLEKYLGSKYVGQKRFSLEGGESFIPMLHALIEQGAAQGIDEVVIGMAHRGRLNVMLNILGMPSQALFDQFEGKADYGDTSGDVKYHMGYSSDQVFGEQHVHVSLGFNPSHLEFIAAVVMGSVRARQDKRTDDQKAAVLPVIVHGDCALAGQGIVQETLNMSQTRGYGVQGSVHIVINNQVGFTTSDIRDSRSMTYVTDVMRMIDAPVFHVNGDDPEAVLFYTRLACEYRQRFNKDVMIDLVCYRRLGHNEADEPAATQPLMYDFIRKHPTTRALYAQQLVDTGVLSADQAKQMVADNKALLDQGAQTVETVDDGISMQRQAMWEQYAGTPLTANYKQPVTLKSLKNMAKSLSTLPEGFECQRQVGMLIKQRAEMAAGDLPVRWGFAENLAYATILNAGVSVRMSGQDVRRATFAHRHATLHDVKTGATHTPLVEMAGDQLFSIYDSVLSEQAPVGFEYGYATTDPNTLVIWEAQFGDFANGAQVMIDQFISSGWQKWQRMCGLVLLLPHGYEGMGPEHSSARLERFLQLCAQENMQVCVPSTAAQVYHMLCRQALRPCRRPLIVMSPKSLLRHPGSVSSMAELVEGEFQLVIPEVDKQPAKQVTRVILCSGKVYYDLVAKRSELKRDDIPIIRIEQPYPFPHDALNAALKPYRHVKDIVWCQEEPKNQGAWYCQRHHLERCVTDQQVLHYAGRPICAAPAAGYAALHNKRQTLLVDQALGLVDNPLDDGQ